MVDADCLGDIELLGSILVKHLICLFHSRPFKLNKTDIYFIIAKNSP